MLCSLLSRGEQILDLHPQRLCQCRDVTGPDELSPADHIAQLLWIITCSLSDCTLLHSFFLDDPPQVLRHRGIILGDPQAYHLQWLMLIYSYFLDTIQMRRVQRQKGALLCQNILVHVQKVTSRRILKVTIAESAGESCFFTVQGARSR